MVIVQDILVSDDVFNEQFLCNLDACKGACCWEGDFGAPLTEEELPILKKIYKTINPYLSPAGNAAIKSQGTYVYFDENEEFGTPLINGGPCAYMIYDEGGIAQCGIEKAYNDGVIDFKKPISCHLYPIRIEKDDKTDFEALNYDRWDICSAACQKGQEAQLPVYQFLKEAITRKYGAAFYEELEAAAAFLKSQKE